MEARALPAITAWGLWRKIIFRFFFIFFALLITPWTWLDSIPGVEYVTKYYYQLINWAVEKANSVLFHVREVLVPLNGSGDTSYGWAQLWLFLVTAAVGSVIWSLLDRKRPDYVHLNYWLCLFVRYYIALIAFTYGIIKIFCLQMAFPSLSQLATPLGDLLPMRLSWMFIGYSSPYQVFSGIMEVLAGLLLLYRRTATLGTLLAFIVFTNVMVLNLSYDIPVKIFSMEMVALCLFLLLNESNRIICFFILNKPSAACGLYHFSWKKKWLRVTRVLLKTVFIILFVGIGFYNSYLSYQGRKVDVAIFPLEKGVYDVAVFSVNNDTIGTNSDKSFRWEEMIFEKNGQGSMKTADTLFRRRYERAYFNYTTDSSKQLISIKKFFGDKLALVECRYETTGDSLLKLWGKRGNDSLYIELRKSRRHFQLAERQFHWLSEQNR